MYTYSITDFNFFLGYKPAYLMPVRENIKRLLDDKKMRDELVRSYVYLIYINIYIYIRIVMYVYMYTCVHYHCVQ
jgi:hypothetical protein